MAGTNLTYTYTSWEEITRLFSAKGVDLRVDDLTDNAELTAYKRELCEDSTDIANSYFLGLYDADDLALSRWVRMRVTWIACYLLSQRRGNPALFIQRYQDCLLDFERVQNGIMSIPNVATSANLAPKMSNIIIDQRHAVQKARVVDSTSTGGVSEGQHLAWRYPFDWL